MDGPTGRMIVQILGQTYVLKGSMGADRMRRVAEYVDGQMRLVAEANPRLGTTKVAVLAALILANRLLSALEGDPGGTPATG